MEKLILELGVKMVSESFHGCTEENIFTDQMFKVLFKKSLEQTKEDTESKAMSWARRQEIVTACANLIARIAKG